MRKRKRLFSGFKGSPVITFPKCKAKLPRQLADESCLQTFFWRPVPKIMIEKVTLRLIRTESSPCVLYIQVNQRKHKCAYSPVLRLDQGVYWIVSTSQKHGLGRPKLTAPAGVKRQVCRNLAHSAAVLQTSKIYSYVSATVFCSFQASLMSELQEPSKNTWGRWRVFHITWLSKWYKQGNVCLPFRLFG